MILPGNFLMGLTTDRSDPGLAAVASCKTCPRQTGPRVFEYVNRPDDGTCDYCGSLSGDDFMARLEAGDVVLVPTDKNYKVYVRNQGGAAFKQTYRTDPGGTLDQTKWVWTTREVEEAKFYFQHLSPAQQERFVELLNAKKIALDFPHHFYRAPFFIKFGGD